jgi:hypothetical protein
VRPEEIGGAAPRQDGVEFLGRKGPGILDGLFQIADKKIQQDLREIVCGKGDQILKFPVRRDAQDFHGFHKQFPPDVSL